MFYYAIIVANCYIIVNVAIIKLSGNRFLRRIPDSLHYWERKNFGDVVTYYAKPLTEKRIK
ncbi:MAG: hypothetical protein IEMM0007_1006 [bacterium]|nr:MAG: hypothetical protein IEMM0007_1006 [bacterium]